MYQKESKQRAQWYVDIKGENGQWYLSFKNGEWVLQPKKNNEPSIAGIVFGKFYKDSLGLSYNLTSDTFDLFMTFNLISKMKQSLFPVRLELSIMKYIFMLQTDLDLIIWH